MAKISHIFIVLFLLLLIVTGLNVCNQGINSLTQENRKPILSFQLDGESDQVSVFTLGQEYNYSKENWELEKDRILRKVQNFLAKTKDLLKSFLEIWNKKDAADGSI